MSRFWTILPHFCGGRACFKGFWLGNTVLLSALLLSGCGESTPRGYTNNSASDTLAPISAPPGADQSPAKPGTTGTAKTADGLPALTAKSVNTQLFSTRLDDEVKRLDRLENAVQELRNDFDAMAPAIVRLVAIEKDIQNLISQLEVLTGGGAPAPVDPIDSAMLEDEPVAPASAPLPPIPDQAAINASDLAANDLPPSVPPPAQETTDVSASRHSVPEAQPPPPTATPPPAAATAPAPAFSTTALPAVVEDVRVGAHPGKVRLVLDVRGKTSFTADLDNQEKILIVELAQASWGAESQQSYASNPVLTSYSIETMQNGGTRLMIVLKTASSLLYKAAMDDADGTGSRVVIDLAAP